MVLSNTQNITKNRPEVRRTAKIVPWQNWQEWERVFDQLFSGSTDEILKAVDLVSLESPKNKIFFSSFFVFIPMMGRRRKL